MQIQTDEDANAKKVSRSAHWVRSQPSSESDDSKHWSTRLRQTLSLTTFTALVEKVITCALGEYDPGYAQNDGRTLSKMWSPVWNTSSIVNLE